MGHLHGSFNSLELDAEYRVLLAVSCHPHPWYYEDTQGMAGLFADEDSE